jgi:hypothetical protein
MMLLFRTFAISALLLGPAHAQQTPPLPAPMFDSMPHGCVWAGRPFSDGAGFCVADKILQTCGIGKWSRETSEGCRGALADTR